VGVILPTGIATDYYNQDYFSALVAEGALASLYDFENRQGLFPGVHRSYKFSLLTLTGSEAPAEAADYAFFLHQVDELADPERHFALTAADLRRINPNTGTCPVFRTRRDAELTAELYRACPVWVNQTTGENPWGVSFLRMIDPFSEKWSPIPANELSVTHIGNGRYQDERGTYYLPMYEGKMMYPYDHRFADVVMTDNVVRPAQPELSDDTRKVNPDFVVTPRCWIAEENVRAVLEELGWKRDWLLAQKKVTSPTNERTHLATILPLSGTAESLHTILVSQNVSVVQIACLTANLNAFPFDFAARQKLGGVNFNYFVLEQLPVLPPETYARPLTHHAVRLTDYIVPRVLELTYTAWDLRPFADDVWVEADADLRAALLEQWEEARSAHFSAPLHGDKSPTTNQFPYPPFTWDEGRRSQLRAELDALYAHLYGLSREELAYILETFPIVKRRDEGKWGEFRTKRLVLEAYERFVVGAVVGASAP